MFGLPTAALVVAVAVGLLGRQRRRYWLRVPVVVLFAFAMSVLFRLGGTLEEPTGDGIVTAWVRRASADGPVMGLLALAVIVATWGTVFVVLSSAYERAKDRPLVPNAGAAPRRITTLRSHCSELHGGQLVMAWIALVVVGAVAWMAALGAAEAGAHIGIVLTLLFLPLVFGVFGFWMTWVWFGARRRPPA